MQAPSAGAPQPAPRRPPPPDGDEPSLALGVGDLVVYASHGIGRVEASEPADGPLPERIVLGFASGLRVTLPLARARELLRRLSGEPELEEVQRTLGADVPASTEPWSRRYRTAREKLAAGGVDDLAEIVRDGVRRERRPASGRGRRPAAPSENELYRQARGLLVAEVAACRGIDPEAADAWILRQVGGQQA